MSTDDRSTVTRVPEGHRASTFQAAPAPGLEHTPGGVLLAHLGTSSDDAAQEFAALADAVERALSRPTVEVIMSAEDGSLSKLFATADPLVIRVRHAVIWTLYSDVLAAWAEDRPRLRMQLRRLHQIGARVTPRGMQQIHVVGKLRPGLEALVQLLEDSGIRMWHSETDAVVMAEVQRPDGVTLSVLIGTPLRPSPAREWSLARPSLGAALVDAELERRLGAAGGSPAPVTRAPRLRRALLAEVDGAAPRASLLVELAGLRHPLLLLANADGTLSLREWPGVGPSLVAYPDLSSLGRTVAALALAPGTFAVTPMTARRLFAWAAELGKCVMLNVYRAPESPLYVKITPNEAAALASGAGPAARG